MTSRNIAVLITLMWFIPVIAILIVFSLNARLTICSTIIERLYCDNFSVVKLACDDTTVNNIYGLTYTTCVFGVFLLILYTYIKILLVIFSGSKKSRQKAVSTCTPHLASLLNFSCGCFLEAIQSRFNMNGVPILLRIFLSLYFLICQPGFNPVVYGLTLTKIRIICKNLVFRQI
ncbi:olfactory receptor 11A1-like [Solea senegalensis]|uniref:Olfactory receptor 11A1-like n=1 Tax=Solea senegalensis TaxID=28829 RepID=A0AAV6PHE3_SOLSE|nr:olfactory receptor 52N5-like [Solea senegalensis]KAG7464239.1 olfactory receptor 11A1-like [Solea senegalensis]